MAIQYPSFSGASDTTPGIPDYQKAIASGLANYIQANQAKYTPRNLENEAVKAEQYNMERKPYAENANRIFNADIGGKEGTLKKLMFDMAMKKREYEQQQFLNNLLNGGEPNAPSSNNGELPGINKPGHMTAHGFEGSLTGVPAQDYYANTGEDRQAEQEAIDRIDRSESGNNFTASSSIPSVPLAQNIKQGLASNTKNNNEQILSPGNESLSRINDIWENYPEYRKELEKRGLKKTQTVKYDPKTGVSSVITSYPNGKTTVKASGSTGENSPSTMAIKTANQKTINGIRNARPIIEKLIKDTEKGNVPGQWIGHYFHPDLQAAYYSDVIQSSDTLASAFGYPGTGEGLHKAEQTVIRKPRESDNGYVARLKSLLKDMDVREENAGSILTKGINTKKETGRNDNSIASISDEELMKIAGYK